MDTLILFSKNLNKGHWPLHDLWPHVCWGHMCDSTQGSLCPSPMTIHQCMWIQWSILHWWNYHIHTRTYILHTYILHTTYRMSDHIVSYWTQFRRDKNLLANISCKIQRGHFWPKISKHNLKVGHLVRDCLNWYRINLKGVNERLKQKRGKSGMK